MSQIRSRPGCRKAIVNLSISPYLDSNGEWDGETALSRNGTRSDMSDGLRDQMRLMVAEGYWGDVKLKRPAPSRKLMVCLF
jgi:hypothetical protein